MLTPKDILNISAQFDAQLIVFGDWPKDEKKLLNSWLEQVTTESRGRVAADIIASYLIKSLKNDISIEGRVRIKKIRNAASILEQLVFNTRKLDEKFYRDHINHMLKVALLARAIAKKKPFCLSDPELKMLTLACVFHDIAYPLSECGRIFSETLESLKECFSSAELFTSNLVKEPKADIESLATIIGCDESQLGTYLRKMNHGLLSALEFKALLNNQKSIEAYSNVIRAIALHDSDFKTQVSVIDDPIVGLLILADELQDWGRPSDQDLPVIPRIEDFDLGDGCLKGEFIAENAGNFSVLKQISSKMDNLSRLQIDSAQLKFEFRYAIQGFERINHDDIQFILGMLFNSVDNELMDPSRNKDLSESIYFEKGFFGLEITMPVKDVLYRHLKSFQLSKNTIFNNIGIYLNEDLSEMILTDKGLDQIDAIVLGNEKDSRISVKIIEGNKQAEGHIYSSMSQETLEYSRFLAAEIRFINYMIHEIGGVKVKGILNFPKLEGLAEPSVLERVSSKLGSDFNAKYEKLKLKSIVNCLRNRGCFLFR